MYLKLKLFLLLVLASGQQFANEESYEKFWAECASELDWYTKWDTVLEWDAPFAKWFEGGTLNVSYNCLDRHVINGRAETCALIYLNEVGDKRTVTYSDLLSEVNRLANVLKAMDVKKGDRVAIYMPMVPEAIASMLACTRIGAVHLVIFGGMGAASVKERIIESEAKVLITADGSYRAGKIVPYKSKIDSILDDCLSVQKTIVLQHTHLPTELKPGRDFWYHEEISNSPDHCEPERMASEDPLFILYTSGTTGKPKGILHTTGGYLVGVHNTFKWMFEIKENDVYWSTSDIGWITGHSYVAYAPLSNLTTQVLYEGSFDYPSKKQFANIIDECQVTIFYTAPTLIRMFMKWGAEYMQNSRLGSLRVLGSVGEPINPETWQWYHKNIGNERCPIVDTWFQTELGAAVIAPIPYVTPLVPGTATKALPGYFVDVLDDAGEPSDHGYLAILRPFPSMMRTIYKDSPRYQSAYWDKWDGKYYFAGDYASKDGNGNFWVLGRCDEVLKVSGHRIGTAEVENALMEDSRVAESAVIGVHDPIKGEQIIAFVILKDGVASIERDLQKMASASLGSYASPSKIVVVNELPKTKSGKILRRVLKNLVEGIDLGNISTINDPSCLEQLETVCKQINQELYHQETVSFKEVRPEDETTWKHFTSSFQNTIAPIYGPQEQALKKIEAGVDRKAYLMYEKGEAVGILVFKTLATDEFAHLGFPKSLEVKSLFVINSKNNSGRGHGSKLVDKIIEVAKLLNAESIHLTVSEQVPQSLAFFQKKKFNVIATTEKHHETGLVEYTLARYVD